MDNDVYTAATEGILGPSKVQEGTLSKRGSLSVPIPAHRWGVVVMFESSMMMTITEYAMNSDKRHGTSITHAHPRDIR